MQIKTTKSSLETVELGEKIGNLVKNQHVVILLDGNLAAGKTTLTKGIAKGMGINDIVNSPTFTIMKQYSNEEGRKLYHLDLYRLNEMGMDFDLEEYVDDLESVVVIEWPYQVSELLPEDHIYIRFEGIENLRKLKIESVGSKYTEIVAAL